MAEIVTMPKLGFDMAEGTLVRWVKAEGEAVKKGEVLAEIETDKATVEVESSFKGMVKKHLVESGAVVPVGTPIAIIGGENETVDESISPAGEKTAPAGGPAIPSEQQGQGVREGQSAPQVSQGPGGGLAPVGEAPGGESDREVKASPLARRMARENRLPLDRIEGSGPGGRVVKKDIEAALSGKQLYPAQAAPAVREEPLPKPAMSPAPEKTAHPVDVPLTSWAGAGEAAGASPADVVVELNRLRSAIGRRMSESKQQLPHFYVSHEYDVEKLMQARKEINELLSEGEKLSVNDFIVKAVALCLRRYPNLNASIDEKNVIRHGHVNIGNAVAVPGGLLTVVSRDADMKPLRVISKEVKEMAARVRDGKVRPEDIEGSTFSISNLGMYNVEDFIAIINPPEAAILAVGTARQTPVVVDGEIKVGWRMKATISADHRVTDGAEAAEFMNALADYLERPMRLLV
jgi:pyruvate dehydrogenase E2 component (dihydrolipoamide acetyltransferase)